MAAPLTESATYDAQVIVPEDGIDDETALSLAGAFQSLANRTKYLVTRLGAFASGGTVTTEANLLWQVLANKTVSVIGGLGSVLDLSAIPTVKVASNLYGPLCGDATNGRLPHKLSLVNSSQDINPVLKSMFLCTPSANINLTINLGSESVVAGDYFHVLNRSTSYTITIYSGATIVAAVPAAVIGVPAVQEVIWDGSAWVYGRRTV